MGNDAFIVASYPFVIFGSLAAFVICLIAVHRTRKHKLPIWWLFVGICLNMLALTGENIWFGIGRLGIQFDWFNHYAWFIAPAKIIHATGAWLHFFGALAVLLGLGYYSIRFSLIVGIIVFLPIYAYLVWALY